jgi:hypothetical protein
MSQEKNFERHEGGHSKVDRNVGEPITEKRENDSHQREQNKLALKSFRLTRDESNSFSIQMDDGSTVKDRRAIASKESCGSNQRRKRHTCTVREWGNKRKTN